MTNYERVAELIRYLDERQQDQPDLASLAARAGLSQFHVHRLFSAWAGITPKDFLQCLTLNHLKGLLRQGDSILGAALDAGLSGPGRAHDLCITLESASPGEIKSGGAAWTINFGFAETPFGQSLLGEGPRGVCHLSFIEPGDEEEAIAGLQKEWVHARFERNDTAAASLAAKIFQAPVNGAAQPALRAFVRGSAFQLRVWRALLQIPQGAVMSYSQVALALGNRDAARAVGTAVSQNPLAYLIPCHRVIRETGVSGEYRWGAFRKRAILAWEGSLQNQALMNTHAIG